MAGLLDFLSTPDAQLGMGLLAASGPSTTPMNAFQRIQMAQQGMNAGKTDALRLKLLESQIEENKSQEAVRRAQVETQAKRNDYFLGGGTPSAGGPGGVPSQGKFAEWERELGIRRDILEADYYATGGKKIAELLAERTKPNWINVNGNLVNANAPGFQGGMQEGVFAGADGRINMLRKNQNGGFVSGAPAGSVETFSAFEDAKNRSAAGQRPFKVYNPATKQEEYVSEAEAVSGGRTGDPMVDAVIQTESGGNPNAVSPKGARGLMQVMPGTNTAPGFGVPPAKDGTAGERTRVGKDYLGAMQERYGNPTLAAIAYNWGPGNTDMWLKSGGDYNKLPQETKQYVSAVMTRSAVNGRAGGGRYAAGPSADEAAAMKAAEVKAVDSAKADVVRDTETQKKGKSAGTMIAAADRAIELLKQGPTASGLGEMVDKSANFFGQSNKGAQVSSQLDIVAGDLVNNVPRMEGPQSNADMIEYRTQAGKAADRTVPIPQRLAAMQEVKRLQTKYAGLNGGTGNTGDASGDFGEKPASKLKTAPSDADLRNTALKYGMTVEQVKKKLGIE